MSLEATIKTGATAIAATGGDDQALVSLGIVNNTNPLMFDGDADQRTRRTATFSVKPAKVSTSAPNGYTQIRNTVVIRFPRILANGNLTVDTFRGELSRDVETTAAQTEEMLESSSQMIGTSAFLPFWADSNLT